MPRRRSHLSHCKQATDTRPLRIESCRGVANCNPARKLHFSEDRLNRDRRANPLGDFVQRPMTVDHANKVFPPQRKEDLLTAL